MKTYKQHLISTRSFGEKLDSIQKPIFRSSAIFPVINNNYLETNVTFMGYWLLKRNISEVSILVTLRDNKGKIIKRKTIMVDQIKSYKVEIRKLINKKNFEFIGSVELEVFSSRDMVYPYPAFVLNYLSQKSSTFVHSCGRIYNNFEDLNSNSDIHVPESGFDIIPNIGFLPYFAFVNGEFGAFKKILKLEIINFKGKKLRKKILINKLRPLETKFIFFLTEKETFFLEGKKGTVKIFHDFKGFFPRFICGNMKKDNSIFSLTHTYYDTSNNYKDSFWLNPDKKNLHDSIITFPIFYKKKEYTDLVLYPIYPKSNIKFDLEIYNPNGNCIERVENIIIIKKKLIFPIYLNIKNYLNKKILNNENFLFAKILINGKGKLPSRLKFGLNIGKPNKYDVPSNICFNAQVPNKEIFNKRGTFKWCPILNHKKSSVVLSNFSLAKKGFKKSIVDIKFWRERDNKFFEKKIIINDNGNYFIDINKNKKIKRFLGKETCWVTFNSDNPFLSGYYLEDLNTGIMGADHLF